MYGVRFQLTMDPRMREDDGYLSFTAIFPSILNLLAI